MRVTFLGLLSLALAGPALASSELQLGSNMPVVLFIDGDSVGTVQPHEPLLVDIEPGVHNLRIACTSYLASSSGSSIFNSVPLGRGRRRGDVLAVRDTAADAPAQDAVEPHPPPRAHGRWHHDHQ